ncbi:hypothetical protein [Salinisphaera sp. Q1T1-3]|uniref:hypothetical protein n=1 Tax=Salinisphaera sp. Q1T1-3 TaxID=2321229 RepID=UPI001314F5F5|nr:hypothetical protein [Salinisphaera sp. Q1T1-3]
MNPVLKRSRSGSHAIDRILQVGQRALRRGRVDDTVDGGTRTAQTRLQRLAVGQVNEARQGQVSLVAGLRQLGFRSRPAGRISGHGHIGRPALCAEPIRRCQYTMQPTHLDVAASRLRQLLVEAVADQAAEHHHQDDSHTRHNGQSQE